MSSRGSSLPRSRNDSTWPPLPRVPRWPQRCKPFPWCLSSDQFFFTCKTDLTLAHKKSRIVRFCACARACVSVWGQWRWRGSSSGAHFRMFPAVLCDPSTSHHMMTEERLDGPRMPHSALSPLLLSLPSKAPFAPVRQDSVLLPFARYSHLLDLGAQSSDPFSTPSRSHGDGFKYHLLHANDFLKY